jgi:hypothetical protein
MGRFRAATLLLAALAAGLLLAACGSNSGAELLPGTTAGQIESNLDLVRSNAEEENCEAAEDAVAEVTTEVDSLQKVDKELKKALKQGAAKLSEVVSSRCGLQEEEAEQAKAEEEQEAEEEEQAALEVEEEEFAEEEAEKEEKAQEREEKAQEKAEERAEQPGPPEEGEESGPNGKAKGHEEEQIETPGEEEVTPPNEGGGAGGIGPGAEAGGG